jgi:hypothetical protein
VIVHPDPELAPIEQFEAVSVPVIWDVEAMQLVAWAIK